MYALLGFKGIIPRNTGKKRLSLRKSRRNSLAREGPIDPVKFEEFKLYVKEFVDNNTYLKKLIEDFKQCRRTTTGGSSEESGNHVSPKEMKINVERAIKITIYALFIIISFYAFIFTENTFKAGLEKIWRGDCDGFFDSVLLSMWGASDPVCVEYRSIKIALNLILRMDPSPQAIQTLTTQVAKYSAKPAAAFASLVIVVENGSKMIKITMNSSSDVFKIAAKSLFKNIEDAVLPILSNSQSPSQSPSHSPSQSSRR
jgi:hypothetical protein